MAAYDSKKNYVNFGDELISCYGIRTCPEGGMAGVSAIRISLEIRKF